MTSPKSTTSGNTQSESKSESTHGFPNPIKALAEKHAIERGWTTTMFMINEEFHIYQQLVLTLYRLNFINKFECAYLPAEFERKTWQKIRENKWHNR